LSVRNRRLAISGTAAFAATFIATASPADGCPNPTITIEPVSGRQNAALQQFERDLRRAIAKVCSWWGASYRGTYRIVVTESGGPSMALVPAWRGERGQVRFAGPAVGRGQAATVHEITHVFAPNANRFLAEGLAVYAHEHLRGPRAFPNFGGDLDALARRYAAQADIMALERTATPARLSGAGLQEREGYIVAGSFVRFLIAKDGFAKFRALYALTPLVPGARNAGDPARWRRVYGRTLTELAAQWRAGLAS
jgi:hypothetical protein